jgi:hypothetical protein
VVQYYFPQVDGSGLKLTVAKYLTPRGYDITKKGGLRPDLACDDFPHGIFAGGSGLQGRPDGCVLQALEHIMAARGWAQQGGAEGAGEGEGWTVHLRPEELQVVYASRR